MTDQREPSAREQLEACRAENVALRAEADSLDQRLTSEVAELEHERDKSLEMVRAVLGFGITMTGTPVVVNRWNTLMRRMREALDA